MHVQCKQDYMLRTGVKLMQCHALPCNDENMEYGVLLLPIMIL